MVTLCNAKTEQSPFARLDSVRYNDSEASHGEHVRSHHAEPVKGGKHFELAIGDTTFTFARKHDGIAAEAALDGIYIIPRRSAPRRWLHPSACAATSC